MLAGSNNDFYYGLELFLQVWPNQTSAVVGIENSAQDIDTLIQVLGNIARRPRGEVEDSFASRQTAAQKQMDDFTRASAQKVYAQIK